MQRQEVMHEPQAKEEFYEGIPRWDPFRHIKANIAQLEWREEQQEKRVEEQSRYQSRPKAATALRAIGIQLQRHREELWRCEEEADLSTYYMDCKNYDCESGGEFPRRFNLYTLGLCPDCYEKRTGTKIYHLLPGEPK